jgi:hypothetical protein
LARTPADEGWVVAPPTAGLTVVDTVEPVADGGAVAVDASATAVVLGGGGAAPVAPGADEDTHGVKPQAPWVVEGPVAGPGLVGGDVAGTVAQGVGPHGPDAMVVDGHGLAPHGPWLLDVVVHGEAPHGP